MSVTAGTMLFRTGDEGDTCYLVERGTLRVLTAPDGQLLASLGPGSFVGELAILLGEPRSATVIAEEDSTLLALSRPDLEALMADHPSLSVAMNRELGRRIVRITQRVAGHHSARRSIVWPASKVPELAASILTYDRRVAVATLAGGVTGSLPGDVLRTKAPRYGADDARLDAVLIGVGDGSSSRAGAVVGEADHVLCFEAPPAWLVDAAPPNRLVRLRADELAIRRATRWATGRALGVTFSSGGSKTVAHMGVILALREAGIEIDAVAGSSGGAIAAAFVACDKDEAWGRRVVADLARLTHFRRLDLNLPPRSALAKGRRLRNAFDKWELGDNLEDASIPTWIVGSDVATGATVVIHSGSVADAIRASLSVPAVFDPWRLGDRLIIDGAVSNPLPSDILRAGGVGVVIASNVAGQASATEVDGRLPSLGQIVGRMLNTMERERIGALLPLADVIIRPRLSAANTFDFSNVDGALAEGRRAAEEHLAGIRSLLAATSGHGVVGVR